VYFASQYLKERTLAGKAVEAAKVIYWGVDISRFRFKRDTFNPLRLLYVGQLMPHKGIHTAIEAMACLEEAGASAGLTLDIVGGSTQPQYVRDLERLVRQYNLATNVTFCGTSSREEIASWYQDHDVLLFASEWEEPFSITLLEAMASGLGIVATMTGGTAEIVRQDENALVFQARDARACAREIRRFLENRDLYEAIRRRARQTVEEHFQLQSMIDQLEELLHSAVAANNRNGATSSL
jgi:glycosyltransferase involved in cell wall biosynthesis